MLIDSGANVNAIDQTLWEALKKQKIQCVSREKNQEAVFIWSNVTSGHSHLSVSTNTMSAKVSVIEGQGDLLLDRKSAVELEVLKLQVPENLVDKVVDHVEWVASYKGVFQGVGKLKGFQLKLHIDPQVPPVA